MRCLQLFIGADDERCGGRDHRQLLVRRAGICGIASSTQQAAHCRQRGRGRGGAMGRRLHLLLVVQRVGSQLLMLQLIVDKNLCGE